MSGGQCRNSLLMRLLADCTGLPIVIPRYVDAAVVFGSALLGAAASEDFDYTREKELSKAKNLLRQRRNVLTIHIRRYKSYQWKIETRQMALYPHIIYNFQLQVRLPK